MAQAVRYEEFIFRNCLLGQFVTSERARLTDSSPLEETTRLWVDLVFQAQGAGSPIR